MRSAADRRRAGAGRARCAAKRRTVVGELKRLRAAGAIDDAAYAERRAAYEDAKRTVRRLSGARKVELGAVVATLEDVAARGQLTASRLAPLFLTLRAQPRVVDEGPAAGLGPARRLRGLRDRLAVLPQGRHPDPGARHLRQGQRAVVLAPDRRARAGRRRAAPARRRARRRPGLGVLLPLPRGQGAVGLEPRAGHRAAGALARGDAPRAARRRSSPVTSRGLGIFERAAPEGVRVPAGDGTHYAQYSFEPGLRILNGFVQSLVGLYDYAPPGGRRARAGAVRDRRGARPRRRCRPTTPAPGRCTRAGRSRASPTSATTRCCATSSSSLCNRTKLETYCGAVDRFTAYLRHAAGGRARARRRLRGGAYGRIRDVARQDLRRHAADHARRASSCTRASSGTLSRGPHTLGWQVPRRARDLHGHARRARPRRQPGLGRPGDVEVLKPRKKTRGLVLPGLDGAPDDPLHGQGRSREDVGRRRDRPALRRGGRAHDRALHRPRPLARRVARDAAWAARRPTSAAACSPSRCRRRTSSSATGRACRTGSAAC